MESTTTEEVLADKLVQALKADAYFAALPQLNIVHRRTADLDSRISEILSALGAGVLVKTPLPVSAASRHATRTFTAYRVEVLVLEVPLLADTSGLPTAPRLCAEVERVLHGLAPTDPALPTYHGGNPWTLRVDEQQPREDVSTDDSAVKYLARFNYTAT